MSNLNKMTKKILFLILVGVISTKFPYFLVIGIILFFIIFKKKEFSCPKCSTSQNEYSKIVSQASETSMSNGRITKKGRVDKRYNTTYETTTQVVYNIDCKKCGTSYNATRIQYSQSIYIKIVLREHSVIIYLKHHFF